VSVSRRVEGYARGTPLPQAKGIVAERRRVDMHEAFASLRRYARTNDLRLADVARDVTEGRLDTTLLPRT
jgi:AmiR/NasT family two-component response regulator